MIRTLAVSGLILAVSTCLVFCHNARPSPTSSQTVPHLTDTMNFRIRILVGDAAFAATLPNTPASLAFKSMLPLSLKMNELNRNEKYAALPGKLPTREITPGQIQVGDLMLYGSNTLVLFYESLSSTYRYTPLGKISNVQGLAAALGPGTVSITFELE